MGIVNSRKLIWFNGIQARMIFMLTFASILVFGLFALMYYQAARQKMDTEAGELSLFFANHLSISLAPALWNYDLNASDSILLATMKENDDQSFLRLGAAAVITSQEFAATIRTVLDGGLTVSPA